MKEAIKEFMYMKKIRWNNKELKYLRKNYNKIHISKLTKHLDRTKRAIYCKCARLGLKANRKRKLKCQGYIYLYKPEHPCVTKKGYVLRSHLIIEQKIGRYLTKDEIVHHKNKITTDDRIENLCLFNSKSEHHKKGHGKQMIICPICKKKKLHKAKNMCSVCYNRTLNRRTTHSYRYYHENKDRYHLYYLRKRLKALSKVSLERELNDKEFSRMMELKDKVLK